MIKEEYQLDSKIQRRLRYIMHHGAHVGLRGKWVVGRRIYSRILKAWCVEYRLVNTSMKEELVDDTIRSNNPKQEMGGRVWH